VLQAPVSFHYFQDALETTRPVFSTFFTNHVAGMMHRYWKHAFPEDFDAGNRATDGDPVKTSNILFAMDEADDLLARLMDYCTRNDAALLVASSMGQEAIRRPDYFGEYRLVDPARLFATIGFKGEWDLQLAMQPDFSFRLGSVAAVDDLARRLEGLVDPARRDRPVFRVKKAGATANLGLHAMPLSREEHRLDLIDAGGVRRPVSASELGFERFERDPGTGYHQPRGIALVYRPGASATGSREEIDSTRIAPTVLAHFGITPPEYMPAPLETALRQIE
jgi:hypothetical protein